MAERSERSGWAPDPWDAYVRDHGRATYLQTTAWARVKRATGWSATNVGRDGEPGHRFGAQLLTRPIPLMPWRFAYAPRGPLADEWNEATHQAWIEDLRAAAKPGGRLARTAIVRMDQSASSSAARSTILVRRGCMSWAVASRSRRAHAGSAPHPRSRGPSGRWPFEPAGRPASPPLGAPRSMPGGSPRSTRRRADPEARRRTARA